MSCAGNRKETGGQTSHVEFATLQDLGFRAQKSVRNTV